MTLAQWAEPALLWDNNRQFNDRKKPQLLQLTSDDFLPEFLDAMNAEPDKVLGINPVATSFMNTKKITQDKSKLYQPLHSRYYLVTASLICQQMGLPDKEVDVKKGEKTYFVLRRTRFDVTQNKDVEQGWSDDCGWFNIHGNTNPLCKETPKEERFPAHPVSVCTGQENNIVPCKRKIYYGYIATGNRDKYLDKPVPTVTNNTPEEKIKQFFIDANDQVPDEQKIDPNRDEFDTKVIANWKFLIINKNKFAADPKAISTASLYILLDLMDILQRTLLDVWNKIDKDYPASVNLLPNQQDLYQFFVDNTVDGNTFVDTFNDLKSYIGLVRYDETATEPTTTYDVSGFTEAEVDTLTDKVIAAFDEAKPTMSFTDKVAEERLSLIENQVRPVSISGTDDFYFLRMAYEYDPECPPIESIESPSFTFARNLEPDAPARLIRIEMPSIKAIDLRKFRHGVGMQLSPELRKVMNGINKDMLKGEGLDTSSPTSFDLGMICTFSIQIITLIAFILMFIIAIMLNIVFWWLAFLKICLPIPKST